MSQLLNDFQKQDIKFDINKLKNACDEILNIKGFDTSLGISHFASISLNQIPEDPDSIKGNNAGAAGKVYDSQLLYNQYYLGNCIIGVIMVFLLYKNVNFHKFTKQSIDKEIGKPLSSISDKISNR